METLNKYRLCFTINPARTYDEIISYKPLIDNEMYQGIEIFYPHKFDHQHTKNYILGINELLHPQIECVLHLPFGSSYDLCNLDSYRETIDVLKEAIIFGTQFNVSRYTLHLGYFWGERDNLINHLINVLQELCSFTNKIIMIENMPRDRELGFSPKEILYLIKQTKKDNLKFIFDTGHANVAQISMDDYFHLLGPYLEHIHISDNNGLSDEHMAIGKGNIDFKKLLKLTKNYKGLYCLEILYNNVDDLSLYYEQFYNLLKK